MEERALDTHWVYIKRNLKKKKKISLTLSSGILKRKVPCFP